MNTLRDIDRALWNLPARARQVLFSPLCAVVFVCDAYDELVIGVRRAYRSGCHGWNECMYYVRRGKYRDGAG